MCSLRLFALYSCDAWEHLTFDSLEEGTTTCRDVRNLVCETELVDTSYRVTTTDEGECTFLSSLGNSLTYSTRTWSELFALEAACRTVPEDGLGTFDSLSELGLAHRTNVETFPTVSDCVRWECLLLSTWLEREC